VQRDVLAAVLEWQPTCGKKAATRAKVRGRTRTTLDIPSQSCRRPSCAGLVRPP
jgi:hypothetical protein